MKLGVWYNAERTKCDFGEWRRRREATRGDAFF
jgi:hypothetical protein